MSMEIRKHLEVELLAALKQTTSAHLDLKASKNKLGLLADKEKLGEIYVKKPDQGRWLLRGVGRRHCSRKVVPGRRQRQVHRF